MVRGSWFSSASRLALGHGERVVREIDLLFFLVVFVEREVDDPGQFEAVFVDQLQFGLPTRSRAAPAKACKFFRQAGDKEAGIAVLKIPSGCEWPRSAPARCSWPAGLRLQGCHLRRARRYSPGPAGLRPVPMSSCGRRMRVNRRSWPEGPRSRPSGRTQSCRQTP